METRLKHTILPAFSRQVFEGIAFFFKKTKFFLFILFTIYFTLSGFKLIGQFAFVKATSFEQGGIEVWREIGKKFSVNISNQEQESATISVQDNITNASVGAEESGFELAIQEPFIKTWWSLGVFIIVFFGLFYLLRRYELNRLGLKQELEIEHVEANKLAELDIEKNKFFSNISHEFRTPLTLILGPLDRIIVKLKNEEQLQDLKLVKRNAQRLQTLINQLLSLSKLESGKMKLKARQRNIVQISKVILKSFQSMAETKNIRLEFEADAEEYILYIDPLKIEKILNNLISNAFKFSENGGKIKLCIRKAEDTISGSNNGIVLKVIDTGIGIRKEKIPHIFDRFYQVDEEQMKTYLGTGIGLALTKELVELHHGTIEADGETGVGATFTIFLPFGYEHLTEDEVIHSTDDTSNGDDEILFESYTLIQTATKKPDLKKNENNNTNPLVLIVEDNKDMREYVKSYLVDSYNIIEASNGKEGFELAVKEVPDLIVSDLMMPIVDGNEMTVMLKQDEKTSHIPIILLTAKASMESKLQGLETGADDFLTKPFDANELLIRIKNLIIQRKKLKKLLSHHVGDINHSELIQDTVCLGMSKLDEKFLEKATNIVDQHIADIDFSVEKFASEMAMSRVQLHRKLKGLTDQSASDFVRNLRLKKAGELIKTGDLNITQVSYEVGISSLSYFAKTFKEKYGVSPSEYA